MNEQLISLETAKIAKEKGFHQYEGVYFFDKEGKEIIYYYKQNYNKASLLIARPAQTLLQKWLREVYKIVVYITPNYDLVFSEIDSYYGIVNNQYGEEEFICSNKTYEASLEVGLYNALLLIK